KDPSSFNEYPLLDYPDKPQPPLPDLVSDEYDRQRRNEKNRLKQLRRKPRFHYTRLPYLTILFSTIQVIVFIVELVKMSQLTGSAFQSKPYFNPMLGPSTYVLINMGARYVPCMHQIEGITDDPSIAFPCANSTNVDTNVCSLNELCGLGGFPLVDDKYVPDQWYRIFIPIFLHAGFLHIIFNLLLQVTMGSTIERNIGYIKYFIVYMLSGIGGFLLGANYSPDGIASTGCSGALFGIMATNLIMFAYAGRKNSNIYGTKHYALFICIMVMEIIISLVLGLLPGLDNFSHIGGFAIGILTSVLLLPDPFFVYIDGIITYNATDNTWQQVINNWNPFHHFDDKIPVRFYIWCVTRVAALALIIVYFTTLSKNFFNGKLNNPDDNNCKWCKYINCIPVHGWCDIGEVTVLTSGPSATSPPLGEASATDIPSTPTNTLPSSIENGGERKRRQYKSDFLSTFQKEPVSPPQISSLESFIQNQSVGLGLYIIIAFFTFSFLKKK
ncbi:rhomboid-domain-containing protein, partial [Suhomyces tanzawaensis NRRL Y-17324]